jgi:hypothetical protein
LVAGLLAWVPACGAKEEPAKAPPGGGGSNPTQEIAAVDPADVTGYDAWLKANGLEAPEVSLSGHRGGGGEATTWPLLPRGDVRLDGLTVWRLEVDLDSYDPAAGGVLEFRKGKDVLWRDSVAFDPKEMRIVQGGLPKSVLDAVKVGDTVAWGIAFEKQPKRSMLGEFKVVNKPSAAKQIDRIENDRQNARQSPKVKALGRGQALLNNSLYAEALLTYMELAVGTGDDPIVQEAGYRIVECMRRLGLDESPLYADAMALAGARKGKRNPGANTGVTAPVASQGLPATAPYVPTGAMPDPTPTPPGPGPAPAPGPTPSGTKPQGEAARRAVAMIDTQAQKAAESAKQAEERAKQLVRDGLPPEAQIHALRAAADAARGTPRGPEAQAALDAALAKLAAADQARKQADDAKADPHLIARLREMAVVPPAPGAPAGSGPLGMLAKEAEKARQDANALQQEADRLRRDADAVAGKEGAEGIEKLAQDAAKKAEDAANAAAALQKRAEQQLLDGAGKPGVPPTPPTDQRAVLSQWVHRLDQEAQDLAQEAADLQKRSNAAQEAGDADLAKALKDRSFQALEAARVAKQRAEAAQAALLALSQAGG